MDGIGNGPFFCAGWCSESASKMSLRVVSLYITWPSVPSVFFFARTYRNGNTPFCSSSMVNLMFPQIPLTRWKKSLNASFPCCCEMTNVKSTYLYQWVGYFFAMLNPLNPELNPICYLLALLGAHHFLHVSRIRVKLLTFRLLMLYIYIYIYMYIYGAPILDVSRSHTTTQHSR